MHKYSNLNTISLTLYLIIFKYTSDIVCWKRVNFKVKLMRGNIVKNFCENLKIKKNKKLIANKEHKLIIKK